MRAHGGGGVRVNGYRGAMHATDLSDKQIVKALVEHSGDRKLLRLDLECLKLYKTSGPDSTVMKIVELGKF